MLCAQAPPLTVDLSAEACYETAESAPRTHSEGRDDRKVSPPGNTGGYLCSNRAFMGCDRRACPYGSGFDIDLASQCLAFCHRFDYRGNSSTCRADCLFAPAPGSTIQISERARECVALPAGRSRRRMHLQDR